MNLLLCRDKERETEALQTLAPRERRSSLTQPPRHDALWESLLRPSTFFCTTEASISFFYAALTLLP